MAPRAQKSTSGTPGGAGTPVPDEGPQVSPGGTYGLEDVIVGCKAFVQKPDVVTGEMEERQAEILSIREKPKPRLTKKQQAELADKPVPTLEEKLEYYVHYCEFNKRLDEWVSGTRLVTSRELEWPKKESANDKTKRKVVRTGSGTTTPSTPFHPSIDSSKMAVGVASKLLDAPFSHVINGKTVDTNGFKTLDVIDPATEKTIAQVPIATKETVDQAVDAAHAAFPAWSKTTWDERAKLLQQYGEEYKSMIPELVKLLTAEQGKSTQFAQHECESILPWFTELAKVRLDEKVVHEDDTHKAIERYVPLGVCAGIVPWNFPILLMLWKVTQAVVTGNCVIIKPSPFTPLCDIRIIEAAQKFFPAGVVQIVVGDDNLGPWITEHPRIQKISFTGSTVTGRLVAKSCSATLKRFTLELGGNDPCVVLKDQKDMATTAQNVLLSAFFNSGQVCIAAKRVYVHEDIYDEFKATLAEVVKNFKVGPGTEEGVMFGPINNKMQYSKVGEFFEEAKKKNFNILSGGDVEKKAGFFYPLTIVDNPPEDSRLVQEEPFGPIVPLLKWKDEADLVKRINESQWGLGATVWSSDIEGAERIGRQIESGTIWINCLVQHHPAVPFGGMKSSGIGAEHGKNGLSAYCQVQALWVPKA